MDEQTRLAKFESMKRGPRRGFSNSKNKKLFMVHNDLQKQCDRTIKRHEYDVKVATAEIRREQMLIKRKQTTLEKQQKKVTLHKEKTNLYLDKIQRQHNSRERTFHVQLPRETRAMGDMDLIRTIGKLAMTTSMKKRLKMA